VCEADTKNLGVETKVEVNAANGKMIEVSTEAWEIGKEADEKNKRYISDPAIARTGDPPHNPRKFLSR